MSSFITDPSFLLFEVVDGDPTDYAHPLLLPITTWSKWFWRVRQWTMVVSGTDFAPNDADSYIGWGSSVDSHPINETEVAKRPFDYNALTYPLGWSARFHEVPYAAGGGRTGSYSAQMHLYTQDITGEEVNFPSQESGPTKALRWSRDGNGTAASLVFRLGGSMEGVGDFFLSSIFSEGASLGGTQVTRTLTIDPDGANIPLTLYGIDQASLSMAIRPSQYWSWNGKFNTETGALNPGFSLTVPAGE